MLVPSDLNLLGLIIKVIPSRRLDFSGFLHYLISMRLEMPGLFSQHVFTAVHQHTEY